MSASSLLVAVAITNSSSSPSSSSTPSSSSHEHPPLCTIGFPFKPTKATINISKVKPHYYLLNSPPFSLVSRSLRICTSAAFDGFETIQSTQLLEEEEEGEEVEENDGAVVSQLTTEGRRLYVGNLPYFMTSSQLADVFAEAGRVVSVEVCSQLLLIL